MDLQRTSSKSTATAISAWFSLFALQDVVLLGYLVVIWALVRRSGASVLQATSSRHVYACVALAMFGAVFTRAAVDVPARVRAMVYRLTLTGVVLGNYLMLRDVLPLVRPDNMDAALLRMDLAVFAVEPAVWLQRFNVRPVVEYFAFFYYSYFGICITYLLRFVYLARRGRQTVEFTIGTVLVYCVGQLGYIAVPAYGPGTALAEAFAGPVHGGFFWGCVSRAVAVGGAMKDVFPSLHTAAPVWFTFFAFHLAKSDRRYRPLAWGTAFFAANIIFSTMFLRWHYAIDVVAGLVLASSIAYVTPRLARWEEARRHRAGLPGVWAFP